MSVAAMVVVVGLMAGAVVAVTGAAGVAAGVSVGSVVAVVSAVGGGGCRRVRRRWVRSRLWSFRLLAVFLLPPVVPGCRSCSSPAPLSVLLPFAIFPHVAFAPSSPSFTVARLLSKCHFVPLPVAPQRLTVRLFRMRPPEAVSLHLLAHRRVAVLVYVGVGDPCGAGVVHVLQKWWPRLSAVDYPPPSPCAHHDDAAALHPPRLGVRLCVCLSFAPVRS